MVEKLVFSVTDDQIGIARSHFSAHGDTIDLLVVVVGNEKQLKVKTSLARPSNVSELGSFVERWSK